MKGQKLILVLPLMFLHTRSELTASLAHIGGGAFRARDAIHNIPPTIAWASASTHIASLATAETANTSGEAHNPMCLTSVEYQTDLNASKIAIPHINQWDLSAQAERRFSGYG